MKISTQYEDGSIEQYDTESHYTSAGLFKSTSTGAITYTLDLQDLKNGLFVKFWQHDFHNALEVEEAEDAPIRGKRQKSVIARIRYFGDDQVLDTKKLDRAISVTVDGELILSRVLPAGKLVVWTRFKHQWDLYISANSKISLTEGAVQIYFLLHGDGYGVARLPKQVGEEEAAYNDRIAHLMGWDTEDLLNLVTIWKEEQARADEDDPNEEDFGGEEDPDSLDDIR